MLNQTIIKTQEQLLKKREEIERLKLEAEVLDRRLAEQKRLVEEFNEAKRILEEKAQNLINSQEFDYQEVKDECRDIELTEVAVNPPSVTTIANTNTNSTSTTNKRVAEYKKTTSRLEELDKKILSREVNREEAAREFLEEIDKMINVIKVPKPPTKEKCTNH